MLARSTSRYPARMPWRRFDLERHASSGGSGSVRGRKHVLMPRGLTPTGDHRASNSPAAPAGDGWHSVAPQEYPLPFQRLEASSKKGLRRTFEHIAPSAGIHWFSPVIARVVARRDTKTRAADPTPRLQLDRAQRDEVLRDPPPGCLERGIPVANWSMKAPGAA